MQNSEFQDQILSIKSKTDFEKLALELFNYQSQRNLVYSEYITALKIDPKTIKKVEQIPFLPIEFFKTHRVITGDFHEEIVFTSSGTTGVNTSRHYVKNASWYSRVFLKGFELFYDLPSKYCLLALLPSYLERNGSSLIAMVQRLIEETGDEASGFYLRNHEELALQLQQNKLLEKKTILIGVTFGLLDFAEKFSFPLNHTIVMETGGMKGMREELTREEVTDILKNAFSLTEIHSEYGMTELMSQAYSKGNGTFYNPPWMRFFPRDVNDPLSTNSMGRGVLNIIDLANIDSCAFIATQDVGEVFEDGSFKVLGRMDRSDIRGCNLLVI